MNRLETYVTRGKRGKLLSKAFYDLSLSEKLETITEYQERTGRLIFEPHEDAQGKIVEGYAPDHDLYEKCIKAVLQHSPQASKDEYPVPGVANHTTTRLAKVKDNHERATREHQVLSALMEIMDAVEDCLAQQDIERQRDS